MRLAARAEACSIEALAVSCLRAELAAHPKPGLVSFVDSGSHDDMDAALFEASIAALAPYFRRIASAGRDLAGMTDLRRLGLEAEAAMLRATGGINTHRGAIFGLGLLCAAAGARATRRFAALPLGQIVTSCWGEDIARGPLIADSHGHRARLLFGAGGARAEAALGFPSLYRIGLPALRRARACVPDDPEAAIAAALFALMAGVEDTNLLHRGGVAGLAFVQAEARRFIEAGGVTTPDWRRRARAQHRDFVARRLSPGGSADLVAMTLFVAELDDAA